MRRDKERENLQKKQYQDSISVLERKDAAGERMTVDHLAMICTLAVKESLANVFGDKFDCFARNFEKSFRSTLMTLRLIHETSQNNGEENHKHLQEESHFSTSMQPVSSSIEGDLSCNSNVKDCESEAVPRYIMSHERLSSLEGTEAHMQANPINLQLALHDGHLNQQLACVPSSTVHSVINQTMLSTYEKSIMEQARTNDLKTIEIGLTIKKLRLKETQLALDSDLNFLERCKLSMGISKVSFKADKFRNELEVTRHAELLKTCIDSLVAGMLIMLACLGYGVYVYSHKRITEATASCIPSKESQSWWMPKPMSSFNSGLQILRCQVQAVSRMLFGVFMILAISYLLLRRSATSTQMMPVTLILLLLGIACGFAGKLCIDTLGGSGYHWLFYWEALCLLHFFSNMCTSALFLVLHGPINVSERAKGSAVFPYWLRRVMFYTTLLLFLPLLCGFMPFASPGEWKNHFSLLVMDLLPITVD
ncbi:unnamed protein product [Ilex paraguariensis]|uniref:Protein CPR-5 n=1 Tax=Ilex paraguariensis TaxID=185542 RepID=A0ABC8U526_9AQUA